MYLHFAGAVVRLLTLFLKLSLYLKLCIFEASYFAFAFAFAFPLEDF
jgi:hypothetical protein